MHICKKKSQSILQKIYHDESDEKSKANKKLPVSHQPFAVHLIQIADILTNYSCDNWGKRIFVGSIFVICKVNGT